MSGPTTRVDYSGVVHVVAYDGIPFCLFVQFTTCWRETKPTRQHVSCIACMAGWGGLLKEA